ncbi:hypothetical protein AAL_02516 [Moelleriella libera RCEF 2490]|uniref:MFS maltose permease n=1 Tax=Moelleriella libera RCEF 2490 TaxID=1081109 RepID=A0A168EMS1_9HYPO|nr:hypothetical protein AAL_02516 [Moelleriella libera RCEF 2490]
MRSRLVVVRHGRPTISPSLLQPQCAHSQTVAYRTICRSTRSRPSLPFLSPPATRPAVSRAFTSERKQWFKHEAKLVARYTITIWGLAACALVIAFAIQEEMAEREYPTPHGWNYLTRKFLRDAHGFRDAPDGEVNWARCLELARSVVIRLEDAKLGGGQGVVRLSDKGDPSLEVPDEFVYCDISAMSDEWRRGYFEAIMLAAKAAEHVDGWVRDTTRNVVCAPEFVIGPSNPRPKPVPPGRPHAPREEDCEEAYPPADRWYTKILATAGLTSRQKMEAALEYATFMEFKKKPSAAEALYSLALSEASAGLQPSDLPYDPKTLIINSSSSSSSSNSTTAMAAPSMNVLDALTAIANHKARRGDISSALPMYVSLLQARRSLPDKPPPPPPLARSSKPPRLSFYERFLAFVGPPAYPPAGPDGTRAPWRDPLERCQEASLRLYIGEILYTTASTDDGLAWTRDGVDLAEEQLRSFRPAAHDKETKQTCRECLSTGLDNWSTMVSRLARAERDGKQSGARSGMFSFWEGPQSVEGRWAAEEAVVQERVRRTSELLEDLTPPKLNPMSYFKA